MARSWIGCLIGAVICALIAMILAPYIPEPGGHIVGIIAWVAAVVLVLLAVYYLVTGRGTGRPMP